MGFVEIILLWTWLIGAFILFYKVAAIVNSFLASFSECATVCKELLDGVNQQVEYLAVVVSNPLVEREDEFLEEPLHNGGEGRGDNLQRLVQSVMRIRRNQMIYQQQTDE